MRSIAILLIILILGSCSSPTPDPGSETGMSANSNSVTVKSGAVIHYLEIVTPDVEEVCDSYASANGLEFGNPDELLGYARTATLSNGCMIGVRTPLSESEEPVIRPYWLVEDIEVAVAAVVESGGVIVHQPLEIPGRGIFAIYILGGNQHGLWQLKSD